MHYFFNISNNINCNFIFSIKLFEKIFIFSTTKKRNLNKLKYKIKKKTRCTIKLNFLIKCILLKILNILNLLKKHAEFVEKHIKFFEKKIY